MTPTLVHRFAFPIREAIEALLGDAVGDCEGWRIRVEHNEVVIDVIAPVQRESGNLNENHALALAPASMPSVEPTLGEVSSLASNETAESSAPEREEPKGGRNAQRAAIACGERGFWTFLDVGSADAARDQILRRCGVTSRRYLDHSDHAAATWERIDRTYRFWLEGHDVELEPMESDHAS